MLRFSILIPTRDRPDTFEYTLKSVMTQTGDDFEVVVMDNCSREKTRQIVESYHSDKIRYIRSDTILSMTDNWEKGLAECRG